jgi:hypothetical protein
MGAGDDRKEADRQESERKRKILGTFEDKKRRYQAYWNPIYQEVEKHRRFTLLGKQFEEGEARRLGLRDPKEPNLLLTYANHEANKTLMTDYRGKVSPNGGGANEVQARARQHVLRGLQRKNNITQIFNKVRREQVTGGIAYSLAVVDYAGKRGFGKTLRDEFLDDYANVFPDPTVKSVTFDDARDFLICKQLNEAEW